jgi:AcrR family transcriptional regulator
MTDTGATGTEACDPRVARSRAAVLAATVDLLGEVGHAGTTVEAIAERSGVAKTTIYRHWPSRAPLLIDAFHSRVEHGAPPPSGDIRADLVTIACGLAAKLRDPQWSRIMATLIDAAESDPELSELSAAFTRERREAVRAVLDQGIADGELDPGIDTDLAAQLVGGAVFYQRLVRRRAADDGEVQRMVDLVLDGLRRRD